MKTINFELSKKLNELGLLDNIETEFRYFIGEWVKKLDDLNNSVIDNIGITRNWKDYKRGGNDFVYKTLTLEEAIEFLPITYTDKDGYNYRLTIVKEGGDWLIMYGDEEDSTGINSSGKTFIKAIEKMITFLINDKILNPKK